MPPLQAIESVALWVREQSAAERVEHAHSFDGEETLFRVFLPDAKSPHPEFTIVDEVFDDHAIEEIKSIVEREDLIRRALRAPGFRFRLNRDGRVLDLELRVVNCDGKKYRVTRNLSRILTIYDQDGRPLVNAPTFAALPTRIFDWSLDSWCGDIRKWRGANQ